MQDRLKISKKSLNQFKDRLMQIRRMQGQRTNLSKAKKIYLKYQRIYLKIRLSISKKGWSTKKCNCKLKKERDYLKKD